MRILLKLTRFYLSFAIAFSALVGYIFLKKEFDTTALYTLLGVLFFAGSASALNQYQERHFDALMKRTRSRPLPARQLKPEIAVLISIVLGVTGFFILLFLTTPIAALLGLLNMLWYNAIYTPLKRKTGYVVLIGAVTGSLPPIIGWVAAGGDILNPYIIFVAFFMFLWQIPHFWLLLLKFEKDYEVAGFPSIATVISEKQVKFIIFIWIVGTSVSTLFFPMFHIISNVYLIGCLILVNVILILFFYRNTFYKEPLCNTRNAFNSLYLYQLAVLVLLIIEALNR